MAGKGRLRLRLDGLRVDRLWLNVTWLAVAGLCVNAAMDRAVRSCDRDSDPANGNTDSPATASAACFGRDGLKAGSGDRGSGNNECFDGVFHDLGSCRI